MKLTIKNNENKIAESIEAVHTHTHTRVFK